MIAEVGVEAEYKPVEKRKTEELTKHSARGSRHYVLPIVQLADVFTDVCAPNAGMTLNIHVVSQSKKHLKDKM